MSLATILSAPRRRGRPPVSDSPTHLRRRVRCAAYRLLEGHSVQETAIRFKISPRTVHFWIGDVLDSPHPAARELRRKLAQRN